MGPLHDMQGSMASPRKISCTQVQDTAIPATMLREHLQGCMETLLGREMSREKQLHSQHQQKQIRGVQGSKRGSLPGPLQNLRDHHFHPSYFGPRCGS